jgi:hypothetical protein
MEAPHKPLTLAVVQMDWPLGDVEPNLKPIAHFTRLASEMGPGMRHLSLSDIQTRTYRW